MLNQATSGRASQLLTAAYGHGAERLSELAHATRKTDNGRLWLPAAHARRPQHRGRCSGRLRRLALTYSVTVTLAFQKRYLLDDLRLQIVAERVCVSTRCPPRELWSSASQRSLPQGRPLLNSETQLRTAVCHWGSNCTLYSGLCVHTIIINYRNRKPCNVQRKMKDLQL